jgi:hypothetical protein
VAADTPYTRTLRRALATVGTPERLATYLHVKKTELMLWLSGERTPPAQVYLDALDLVAHGAMYDPQAASETGPKKPPSPSRRPPKDR